MNVALVVRVIRGRVVLSVGSEPPMIVCRVVRCPCCGSPSIAGG